MICEIEGNRIANDVHTPLIEMWKYLVKGGSPFKITREDYNYTREHQNEFPPHYVGWVGFNCSYSGKWFGGYAGETKTQIGTVRDYQDEAIRNVLKQVEKLKGVVFHNQHYTKLEIPLNSIIYCDPPYEGTTEYKDGFDHTTFWNWVRGLKTQGHTVFVSEYKAPVDFTCVWEKKAKSSLSANGKVGGNKVSLEKLFTLI